MRLEFDLNNNVEKPEIILAKRNYEKLGSIANFENLSYEYNLMSANSVSFTVYKELNYEKERLWDELKERRLVYLKEFNEWFQIDVGTNDNNGVTKEITGTSLCEAELNQIKIKSAKINTEEDIDRPEYVNPTVFYKPSNPDESLLHRLLKNAPNYTIKYVDECLWNIQRTFSIDDATIYDALTGEVAEEIGCLFLFDSTDRSISVYDLKTNCNHCGYRGDYTDICPECGSTDINYGYGHDTTIFVDSETLAESISLSGKQDEVKNYIKVCGGDEIIDAAVSACNPTGTQYIYSWSDRDKEDMSDELLTKLDKYSAEYERLTPTYKNIMKDIYNTIDEQLKLESTMMPDIEMAETNAQKELAKLTASNLSPVAVQDVSIASVYTANNAVLGMAKCLVNSTVYKIEFIDNSTSFENQIWKGKFKLTNYSDEEDTAENIGYITITINDDYAYYVEQKIRKTINRDDIYLVDIFDIKTDIDVFRTELKKYCLSRLKSFESAYQAIIDVLIQTNCANDSTYGDIYNDLYIPYYNKLVSIQKEEKVRIAQIEAVNNRLAELEKSQAEITTYLNLESFLGNTLWKELCSFRREDSFENNNYISDGLDNTEILKKAQELLDKAKKQAITASTLQMSLSATMFNLLAIPEFKKLTGMFEGGNWIRVGLDGKVYRLRLIHFKISFSEIQNIDVEFSDITQTFNCLNDTKSLMKQVSSMAGNFSYVAHQAEQGAKSFTELDTIRNDGLNTALYNISSSINQEFIIDEHGITGRQWNDILGDYSPEQVKMNNNIICWTDDYWVTCRQALGKIEYYNPILKTTVSRYGLIADAIISGILMGNDIIGGNIYSENYSPTTGTHISLNTGDFTFAGGKLVYNSTNDKMTMRGITIEWDSTTTPKIADINGLSEQLNEIQNLDDKITQILAGTYTTAIGEDYIISPNICGGYLYIKGNFGSVEINPLLKKYNNSSGNIFSIKDSTGNEVIGFNSNGKACFNGEIITESGQIGGWTIGKSSIYKNHSTFGASDGMYFGASGLSIGDSFKVTSGGTVTANGTFSTGTGTYAKLGDGNLTFYRDSSAYSSFGTAIWTGTTTYGTAVHSESKSKFISFGNKSSSSDTTYVTNFLLNYGLNPNGRTENVQVYGSFLSTGDMITDGSVGLHCFGTSNVLYVGSTSVNNGEYYAVIMDNLYVKNRLYVAGADKTRVVNTEHYGQVCLNAYETATPYFGDIGSGVCDENGICYIYLDEIFKETVILEYKYYVFLQPIGESKISLIKQNKDYFIVKGEPNQEFNFEIKCRQKDTEASRLNVMNFEESENNIL